MPMPLGPIEIVCDAPPYCIVRSCCLIGLHRPEDVAWRQMSHFLNRSGLRGSGPCELGWKNVLVLLATAPIPCSCGAALPLLNRYDFTFADGTIACYWIGQCRRCHAVYWEKP